MDTMKKQSNARFIITMLVLGACWATVYLVPFIQYTWYDPFKEFIGSSNAQLGLLMSIYGLGNVFGAPVGGWLADRFNYKILYVLSVVLNGVFAVIFSMFPSYPMAVAMWIGFAVSSLLLNYPTHIKIIRDMSTPENEGKIFGFNETFIGLFNIILSSIMMFVFTQFHAGHSGLKAAILACAVMSFIFAALIWFLLPNPKKQSEGAAAQSSEEKPNFAKDFKRVAKNPATWLVAITIFAIYSFKCTLTYFTPYFTEVMGVTVAFSGWMAIARNYGTQLVGAPVGGMLTDKFKSPCKVLIPIYVLGIATLVYMLMPNKSASVSALSTLVLVVSFFVFVARGSQYATMSEAGVPQELSASTVGIAAAVGFSPDLFQFALFGYWMDHFGPKAYNYMFIYQSVVLAVGILAGIAIMRRSKKNKMQPAVG